MNSLPINKIKKENEVGLIVSPKRTNEAPKQEKSPGLSSANVASILLRKKIDELKRFENGAKKPQTDEKPAPPTTESSSSSPKPSSISSGFDLNECMSSMAKPANLNDLKRAPKRTLSETTNEESVEDTVSKKSKLIDELLKIKSTHSKDVFDAEKNPHYKV